MENPLIQELRDALAFSAAYRSEKHPNAEAFVAASQASVRAVLEELEEWRTGTRRIYDAIKLTKKQRADAFANSPVPRIPWQDYGKPRQG